MRILVCSVGLSPQIVTETLYELNLQRWRPDRLVLLTTRGGREACERQLLAPGGGLEQFQRSVYSDLPSPEFELVPSDNGDTGTDRDIMAFADYANRLVGEICADTSTVLYLLLAGGRKSATAFLALTMSMHGRAQDRLLHVMTEPDMTLVPDFWFPVHRHISLPHGKSLLADQVQISLLNIPFPRLSEEQVRNTASFRELVDRLNARHAPRLVIGQEIFWDGKKLDMPPALSAWLRWLAVSGSIPRVGASRDHYLIHYQYYAGKKKTEGQQRRLPDPLDPEWIEEKVTRIAKLVAGYGIAPNGDKLIHRAGLPGRAIYSLAIGPSDISLSEGTN